MAIRTGGVPSQAGWRIAVLSADHAFFLLERARSDGTSTWWRALIENHAGWALEDAGTCELGPSYPDGFGPAAWNIVDSDDLGPGTVRFVASVTELACASGQSAEDRLAAPSIVFEDHAVIVYFAVRELGGDQHCQGNPPTEVTVDLSEPLGERALFDGSTYPPARVFPP